MTPTTKAGRALLEPMMREALIADMSDPARFDALPADRSGHIRDRLDAYTRALIAAMKDARADEAEALRAALEKALECIHDAERELHVWVDRDRVRHPGWPDVGYEPWSNKPSLALWSVEVDEVERMALAALATPAAPVAASERCPYPHQYDPSGESRCPIHELCRAPIGTYDGVEGGRPWCAVPCPHAPSGASGGRGVTDLDELLATTTPEPVTSVTTAAGRKCRRHQWVLIEWSERPTFTGRGWYCDRCDAKRDDTKSRRGKNNRARGNAQELTVAREVGGRKVGPLGHPWDVEMPGYARLQVKKLATPPTLRFIAAELARIARAPGEEMPGFVWVEPGRGGEQLIVFRLRDFSERHGVPEP